MELGKDVIHILSCHQSYSTWREAWDTWWIGCDGCDWDQPTEDPMMDFAGHQYDMIKHLLQPEKADSLESIEND